MNTKVYDVIFSDIIRQLESGSIPWKKPWKSAGTIGEPVNAVSRRRYNGANYALLLIKQMSGNHTSPVYGTYKQWSELGKQVRKGEHATPIVFWNKKENEETGKDYMFVRYYNVFNESQLEGYVLPVDGPKLDFVPLNKAESIVKNSPMNMLSIKHDQQRAFYNPMLDYINMPLPETFETVEKYYSTLFHEMGHATGHESRLKRDMSGMFGDHSYSREELTAELTSAFLCADAGIEVETRDHAGYCQSWLKKFREAPKEMLSAFTRAVAAVDYVLRREKIESEKPNEESETVAV